MISVNPAAAALPVPPETGAVFARLAGEFLAHGRDVPARLAEVFAADPEHILGWSAKAIFSVMLARGELLDGARQAAARARASLALRGGSAREAAYVGAAEALAGGDWQRGIHQMEQALEAEPEDSLAAKISHGLRFMTGDRTGMLSSIERVITRVGLGHPDAGFLLGCKAFALEENGAYREAEFLGRSAVDREPRDAWGMHAVSHSHEMTGRAEDGIRWIDGHRGNFAHCNNFGYHLFWHLSLFRLELGDVQGVLGLYDHAIRAERSDDYRDIANGASLLQRLELEGVPVGSRWEELADLSERRIQDRTLVFADLHYMLALSGAGRPAAAGFAGDLGETAMARSALQGAIGAGIGAKVARGILAWREKRFAEAAELLLAARPAMQAIGGSHAQRDVFDQMLIDAAVQSGHPGARGLLLNRLSLRSGRNAFARRRLDRLDRGSAASAMLEAVALQAE